MELVDWLADTLKAEADAAGELDALDPLLAYLERNADRLDTRATSERTSRSGPARWSRSIVRPASSV